jgi:hypothetical protein
MVLVDQVLGMGLGMKPGAGGETGNRFLYLMLQVLNLYYKMFLVTVL